MSLKMRLVRIVGLFGVLAFAGFMLPNLGPGDPGTYEGVASPATTSLPVPSQHLPSSTSAPGLPPGFPSMLFPPPEVEVAEGDPIPINTKFGVSYTVPGDWRNSSRGVTGWNTDFGSVVYGGVAMYDYDYCPEHRDGATKALTGMTGRNGVDIPTAAFEASRDAEIIFRSKPGDDVVIEYSAPVDFEIDGAPAVRYSAQISNMTQKFDCDPVEATFDVVATEGFSNATVAVFMVQTDRRVEGALSETEVEQIISTLRREQ